MSNLYVVATPIGNLQDLSPRARQILSGVDLIVCEDTRRTRKLLSHFDIHTPTESYHGDSSDKKRQRLLDKLRDGKDIALVSDAGTPAVSDPGMRLVQAAHETGAEIVAVPGPSAVTAAVSVAGVPGHAFTFLGYAPRKKRDAFVRKVAESEHVVVFFASPHRVEKTLQALSDGLPTDMKIVVCRELTKKFESVVTGSPAEVQEYFARNPDEVRGEFVVVAASA